MRGRPPKSAPRGTRAATVVPRPAPNPRATALRRDDFLSLTFEFVNLRVATSPAPARLVRVNATQPAYIVVNFPPQNIAEEAFFDNTQDDPTKAIAPRPDDPDKNKGTETPTPPPVRSRIAQASRLVFKVGDGVSSIAYTLAALLDRCTIDRLVVAPTALPPTREVWRPPLVFTTGDVLIPVKLTTAAKGRSARRGAGARSALTVDADTAQKLVTGFRARLLAARGLAQIGDVAVTPTPLPQIKPPLAAPTPTQTSIELPYRLVLSPHGETGFAHASQPVISAAKRTELWHTRLGARPGGAPVSEPGRLDGAVRAIWARSGPIPTSSDPNQDKAAFFPKKRTDSSNQLTWAHPGHQNEPFRTTLDAYDRHNIVHLTANWFMTGFQPRPIDVDRLMLTSLGGWLDSRGAWRPPQGMSVEEWRHRAALARDHYVRVVYAGFLVPFGNRASLVKITERKFHPDFPGNTAYLRQRMYIVVGEPLRTFRNTGFVAADLLDSAATGLKIDHQMPLARARITTLVTPNLDKPENSTLEASLGQSAFWPFVNGAPFDFHCAVEDLAGNGCDFTLPMVFVEKTVVDGTLITAAPMGITIGDLLELYDNPSTEPRRRAQVAGVKLAYAVPKTPGDTSFETQSLVFGVQLPSPTDYKNLPTDRARFFPVVRKAKLVLPAAKHFIGKGDAAEFRYPTVFLQNPLDPSGAPTANSGEVFLEVVQGQEIKLDFGQGGGDKAGGLTKPNIAVSGLSRRLGPIAGPNAVTNVSAGHFEPPDFFKVISGAVPAKLFGVIDLWDVVEALGLDDDINAIPRLLGSEATAIEAFLQDIAALKAALDKVLAAGGQVQTKANEIIAPNGDVDTVLQKVASADLAGLPGAVTTLATDVGDLLGLLPGAVNLSDTVRQEAQRVLSQLAPTLANVNDIVDGVQKMVDAVEMAREGRFRFEWKPRLANWPTNDPIFVAKQPANGYGEDAYFVIAAEIRARSGGSAPPSIDVLCGLEKFKLDLIAPARFFGLKFHHIRFVAKPGKKPEVDVLLDGVEFEGPLSFVNSLKDLIPLDGFSDPPALTVDERGIDASFSVPLPDLAIGVFALTNLSLGAGFTVPFIGEPLSARFFFCQRECPFTLQVSFLGGGGFFGITVDPGGVQILEAALEFGATLSVNLGVASGNVHIMAGIYFRMELTEAQLQGYLRMGGCVDVLGLISASIELYLSLSYEFSSGKAVGRASITVEVSVLCFSGSVEISCERKFAGSNGDPTFVQLMGPDPAVAADSPWSEYCAAFA